MKIGIVGAGIAGTLSAYFLAKQGHEVIIFDREQAPAMACSRANGGQISVCNAETWNTWKNVRKGFKWMFQADAPLLIRPTPTPSKIKWLVGFLRHTINGSHHANTSETIRLGNIAKDLYQEIIDTENIRFDRLKTGLLHVYTKNESYDDAIKMRSTFETQGVEYRPVDREEIEDIDNSLVHFKSLVGGIMTGNDWTGDPHLFCKKLMQVLESKYHVISIYDVEVTQIDTGRVLFKRFGIEEIISDFDAVVISAGHEIQRFSKELGDRLNVYPVKGYSITITDVNGTAPCVSLLDDDKKIVSSRLGDRFRVAGTAELDGVNYDIRRSRIDPLLKWVHENFPDVDTSNYSSWACLRPMNSSMMPIVKESSTPGVWYHGAHGHLGWTLSPATALALAEMIQLKNTHNSAN
jgi:D-amino-acid dehydrogenase